MRKFILFAIIGGCGLLVSLAVTYALTTYGSLWYLLSYTIATFISWTVVFFANSFVTFSGHSKERYVVRYLTFLGGYLVIFAWNAALVFVFTSLLHLYYLASIVVVTALSTILTFFFSKRVVFSSDSVDPSNDVGVA